MLSSRRLLLATLFASLCPLLTAADVPRQTPEFAMQLTNNTKSLLSSYRGKTIVFAFIRTTCPHCQKTTQELSRLQAEYAARGVQFLACAFDDEAKTGLPAFIAQYKPSFPVGYATSDAVFSYLQISMMKPGYVPKLVFIDKRGVIRSQHDGNSDFFTNQEQNTRAMIEELLKTKSKS
jgi:peroxiredoxin